MLQNAPLEVLRERARRVEELGFDSLWVADHFVNPYAPEEVWFDGWLLLTALAAETSRIRLGTAVASLTLRNPALLARAAMTLDHVSNGRLELGLGAGGAPLDHAMTGIPAWSPAERVERFAEAAAIVRSLLEEGELDFEGTHYRISGARLRPAPLQRPCPPLTLAALGAKALRVVAQHADSWSSYGVGSGRSIAGGVLSHEEALAVTRERSRLLDAFCAEIGRDPARIKRSYLTFFGILEALPAPEPFLDFAKRFEAAGINELILYWPKQAGDEATLEALAAEALPRLRGRSSQRSSSSNVTPRP